MAHGAPAIGGNGKNRVSDILQNMVAEEAKREAAISNSMLAASIAREKMLAQQAEAATIRADYWESMMSDQAQIIRDLRAELLLAHDIAGQAEGAAPPESMPSDWTRGFGGDRRRVGG